MKLIFPMKANASPDRKDGAHADISIPGIEKKFTEAISSFGYNENQLVRIHKSFSLTKKISTIVSLQACGERKEKIPLYLNEIKMRQSHMSLLFLKATLEDKAKSVEHEHELRALFVSKNGAAVLETAFASQSKDFLNTLLELVVFLAENQVCRIDALEGVLSRYDLLHPQTMSRYINLCDNLAPLYKSVVPGLHLASVEAACLCTTWLSVIAMDILRRPEINDELAFLVRMKNDARFAVEKIIDLAYLASVKGKFKNEACYWQIEELFEESNSKIVNTRLESDVTSLAEARRSIEAELSTLMDENRKGAAKVATLEARQLELLVENMKLKKSIDEINSRHLREVNGKKNIKIVSKTVDMIDKKTAVVSLKDIEYKCVNIEAHGNGVAVQDSEAACNETARSSVATGDSASGTGKVAITSATASSIAHSKANNAAANNAGSTGKPKLGRFNLKSKAQPQKKSKFAEKTYSGLQWSKTSKAPGSIFEKIDCFEAEHAFSFEEFSAFETAKAQPQKSVIHAVPDAPRQEMQACMDPKKSHALNIALGRVKLSSRELLDKILNKTLENENLVSQFILYFPTAEELAAIAAANEPLGRAELFFKEVENIEQLYAALHAMRFHFQFSNREYSRIIAELKNTYKRILESKELRKLFSSLLVVGNVLNVNTFSGNAGAFSIDSLEQFKRAGIIELVSKKVSKEQLAHDLGLGSPLPAEIEAVAQEIRELKKIYSEDYMDARTTSSFNEVVKEFDEMMKYYKEAQAYFMDGGNGFVGKIKEFVAALK